MVFCAPFLTQDTLFSVIILIVWLKRQVESVLMPFWYI